MLSCVIYLYILDTNPHHLVICKYFLSFSRLSDGFSSVEQKLLSFIGPICLFLHF